PEDYFPDEEDSLSIWIYIRLHFHYPNQLRSYGGCYRASGLACHLGFSGDCFATPIKVELFSTTSAVIYRRFARSNKISARFSTPRPRVTSTRVRNSAAACALRCF